MMQDVIPFDVHTAPVRSSTPPAQASLRLRPGTPEQFSGLRALLESIGYTEAGICARAGCSSIFTLSYHSDAPIDDPLGLIIRLFLEGGAVPHPRVAQHLPAHGVTLLESLGLLEADPANAALRRAPLALYPIGGLYFVSDQATSLAGKDAQPADDVVFPALARTTGEFLASLSNSPCENLLDIGAGTGVAALQAAARYARHAWATDITERATRMCEFNARLNRIENVTASTGDLYAPVAGRTFDRIVSHPPYVPQAVSRLIFRDGGADGEQITRRIIEGLPTHLAPGGRFYCRCLGTDRKGASFEQRIRGMLGPAQADFDVMVVTNLAVPPVQFYVRLLAEGDMTPGTLQERLDLFARLEAETIVVGFICIDRHAETRRPLTLRRGLSAGSAPDPASVDWLFGWERAADDSALPARLLAAKPVLSPAAQILLSHRMQDGQLRAEQSTVTVGRPFSFTLESAPGVALLLSACDGSRTVTQLHQQMQEIGAVPQGVMIEEFVQLMRVLIGGTVLELEDYPLPATSRGN